MKVIIQFRGPLAKQFQDGTIMIECGEETTLLKVLNKLLEMEDSVRDVWSSPEIIDRDALILRNESDIGLTGGLKTTIYDGDELVILPLIHGG
ncbi:MAG: MoaD/ThiS family protein [Candidatus Thorarchaeota archaeon]